MQRETHTHFQYRILIHILFKGHPYIRFDAKTRLVVIEKMSHFSVDLGYRSARIRKGIQELQRLHLIYDVQFSYNKAKFYLEEVKLK